MKGLLRILWRCPKSPNKFRSLKHQRNRWYLWRPVSQWCCKQNMLSIGPTTSTSVFSVKSQRPWTARTFTKAKRLCFSLIARLTAGVQHLQLLLQMTNVGSYIQIDLNGPLLHPTGASIVLNQALKLSSCCLVHPEVRRLCWNARWTDIYTHTQHGKK